MTRERILITGGNGYVGRQLTRRLSDRHAVCVVDNLRYGQNRFSAEDLAKISFEPIDIADEGAVAELVDEFAPTVIVHLAAVHYIPECERDPWNALRTNLMGLVSLLLAAPENSRFVYASSGAVYKPDDSPHREAKAALEPNDIYGLTKLHGEHYVRYLAQKRSLAAVIVRLFNVVGPGETNPHLLPEIVAQLKAGHTVVRLGNLWPKRDYIHVEDAARGFATVATVRNLSPKTTVTVNLGTSQPYSVEEILRKLREIANIDFSFEQDSDRVRAVDRPFLAADTTQIQQRFGWSPSFTIDDALRDLWREPDLASSLAEKYR